MDDKEEIERLREAVGMMDDLVQKEIPPDGFRIRQWRELVKYALRPDRTPCTCPDYWFPKDRRVTLRRLPHNFMGAIAHHESCAKRQAAECGVMLVDCDK